MGIQIHLIFQSLINIELKVVRFLSRTNNMMVICIMIKSLAKLGKTVNLTNMGIPIHPRWQSLLNMIFLVTHFFYYPNKMYQMKLLVTLFF